MKTIEAAPSKEFLRSIKQEFFKYKYLGDKTFQQLSQQDFHICLEEDGNSIATIIQHISGNLISRFTDFLISDGEKANRDRDAEFVNQGHSKAMLLEQWEKGFEVLKNSLEELLESDLSAIIYIRHEPMSVPEALTRSLAHISYHLGQIVFLAKYIKKEQWQTLSIAKGKSHEYNEQVKIQNEVDEE